MRRGMKGTTIRRGKTWSAVIDLGLRPAQRCANKACRSAYRPEGQILASCPKCGGDLVEASLRQREWRSGFRTQREARIALNELLSKMDMGDHVSRTTQQLGEFLREWLETNRDRVRPATLDSYRRSIEQHVIPRIGSMQLQEIGPEHLTRFYGKLREGGGKGGRPLSPRSVRYVHAILHRAFRDAVRWKRLSRNPADDADQPKAKNPEMQTWSKDQLRNFLAHVRGDRLFPAWRLAAMTGLRRGELLGLRWEDMNLDETPRLAVRRTLISVGFQVQFSEPKAASSRRTVSLDAETAAVLRDWRKHQLEERMAWGPAYQETGLVFTKEDGSAIHPEWFSKSFRRQAKGAGLPEIGVHGLRHTHATMWLDAGVNIKVVADRLGHSDPALTLRVYTHAVEGREAELAETMAGAIFGEAK